LKSNGDKASPCFRPLWRGKLSDRYLPIQTVFKHILISPTSFLGIPNSLRILCNTSLLTESLSFLNSIKSWCTVLYSPTFSAVSDRYGKSNQFCILSLNTGIWNFSCGNHTDSIRVFRLQKKVVRIMTGAKSRVSCKPLFKTLEILTLPSQYILSLMTFLAHNLEYFTFNSSVHNTDTRKRLQLHRPLAYSTSFQMGVYYVSTKIFNKLPQCIANLVMDKHFK
jgi:hypothetical protein